MKDNKSTKAVHQQGVPWKTAFRASSYEEADQRRNELLHGWNTEGVKNMQIKVKWLASTGNFIIKVRRDPTVTPEPKKPEKKGEKKGRRDKRDRKGRRAATRQEQKD